MNDLSIFSFESHQIRTITNEQGDPWFVLRDLLDSMESSTTTTAAIDSIKQGLGDGFVADLPIQDSLGRTQQAAIVAEAAATYLLARSNTAKGRELNKFIHVEILPQIRKTGAYLPKPMLQRTSQEMIESDFRATMGIMSIFELPKHIAQQEAVKEIRRLHGVDYSNLLVVSPAQNVISDDEVMLEPNDLAKELGFESGAKLNKWLEALGKQVRVNGAWAPTEAGLPYCVKHAWNTQYKTGYNLKWNLSFVKSLLTR